MNVNDIFFFYEVVSLLAYKIQYTACYFSWLYVIKCFNLENDRPGAASQLRYINLLCLI